MVACFACFVSLWAIVSAGDINQDVTNGELFIKELIHGEEKPFTPDFLVFTAPSRLCDGGPCPTRPTDFAMSFPLYIGKKARNKYQESYPRDHAVINRNNPNAPFKRITPRVTTTPCSDRNSDEVEVSSIEIEELIPKSDNEKLNNETDTDDDIPLTTHAHPAAIYPCVSIYPCVNLAPRLVKVEASLKQYKGFTNQAYKKYTGKNEDLMEEWELNKQRLGKKMDNPLLRTMLRLQ